MVCRGWVIRDGEPASSTWRWRDPVEEADEILAAEARRLILGRRFRLARGVVRGRCAFPKAVGVDYSAGFGAVFNVGYDVVQEEDLRTPPGLVVRLAVVGCGAFFHYFFGLLFEVGGKGRGYGSALAGGRAVDVVGGAW